MIGVVIWVMAGIAIIIYNQLNPDSRLVVIGTESLDFGYVALAVGVLLLVYRLARGKRSRVTRTQRQEPRLPSGEETPIDEPVQGRAEEEETPGADDGAGEAPERDTVDKGPGGGEVS